MESPAKTISQVFEEFLADQKARLRPKTYLKYCDIIGLFKSYLESYWPGHNQEEYDRITAVGWTFCSSFGPEEIPEGFSEFLGYFMPRKVMAGKETMKAAATVIKKLAKWLVEKGYTTATSDAYGCAMEAAKDLPATHDVLGFLSAYIEQNIAPQYGEGIDGHFWISQIEPGRIWLESQDPIGPAEVQIGPIPVPKKVTRICQQGWDFGGVVAKTSRGWRLVEIWNVSP